MLATALLFGARIDEIATLRQHNVDRERYVLKLDVFAKGGRPREVPAVNDAARAVIDALPRTQLHIFGPDGRKKARRLQEILHDVATDLGIEGRKGPHRLRANWAQDLLDELRGDTGEEAAKHIVSERLGHGRKEVLDRYAQ